MRTPNRRGDPEPCPSPSIERTERANRAVIILAAVVTICIGLTAAAYEASQAKFTSQQKDLHNQQTCTANWADAFTARADKINAANNALASATLARNTAEDKFLADLRHPLTPAQKLVKFDAYLAATVDYQHKVAAYKQTLRDNPIPPSPRLNC